MRTKILIIVVALVLGGLAAVVAANYLRSARTDIAEEGEAVTVLVAKEDLPRGLTAQELVDRGLVEEQELPRRFVAGDAISSPRVVETQILAVPVSSGEQLTKTRFAYPAQAGLGYSVPAGQVAVSIEVDEVSGVAGLLKPGDEVIVYATYELKDLDGKELPPITQVEVAKAKVLAVGATVSAEPSNSSNEEQQSGVLGAGNAQESPRQSQSYQTVTLALEVRDAQEVVFANAQGRVHLALHARNAEEPDSPKPTWFGAPKYPDFQQTLP